MTCAEAEQRTRQRSVDSGKTPLDRRRGKVERNVGTRCEWVLACREAWPSLSINLLWRALKSLYEELWHIVPIRRVVVVIG